MVEAVSLLDGGSDSNFVSNSLATQLGCKIEFYVNLRIKTISSEEPCMKKTPIYKVKLLLNDDTIQEVAAFGVDTLGNESSPNLIISRIMGTLGDKRD